MKLRKGYKHLGRGIVAALTLFVANNAQAVLIDNFDSGDAVVVSGFSPGPLNTPSGGVGGSTTLQALTGADGATSLAVAGGALNHGQSPVSAGSSKTTWDANGAGLGGLDLTDGGFSNGIQLVILAIDVGMVDLIFDIMDQGAGSSTLELMNLVAGVQNFFFSDFIGNANFTDVDNIMLTIQAAANSDLSLDLIDTIDVPTNGIPEPSALMLFGVALAGLGLRRFKAKAA